MLLGIDISHHQGSIDFNAVRAGCDFVVSKATEGTTFVDPLGIANRRAVKAVGMVSGSYHFARAGDPIAESNFFCDTVGDVTNEFVVLDWEVSYSDPVGWCLAWLNNTWARLGVKPLIYLNQSTRDSYDWSRVVNGNFGLWLAKYDEKLDAVSGGAWTTLAIKQYTDKGTISGVRGAVDRDVFYGDAVALASYCKRGTPVPAPKPPAPKPVPKPTPPVAPWTVLPSLTYGMRGNAAVRSLQSFLARCFPSYAHEHGTLDATGNYLDVTAAWVAEYQSRYGIKSDGKDVGPLTKPRLWADGWRG